MDDHQGAYMHNFKDWLKLNESLGCLLGIDLYYENTESTLKY